MEQNFNLKFNIDISYDSVAPTGYTYESRSTKANLKYGVEFEIRDYGIKNLNFGCPNQEIEAYIELADNKGECDNHLVHIKLTNNSVDMNDFSLANLSPDQADLKITKFDKVNGVFQAEGSIEINFNE